jgi:hypothetical protein
MNRRQMLLGLVGVSSGLLLPRRYWALDQTMLPVASDWVEYPIHHADGGIEFGYLEWSWDWMPAWPVAEAGPRA